MGSLSLPFFFFFFSLSLLQGIFLTQEASRVSCIAGMTKKKNNLKSHLGHGKCQVSVLAAAVIAHRLVNLCGFWRRAEDTQDMPISHLTGKLRS